MNSVSISVQTELLFKCIFTVNPLPNLGEKRKSQLEEKQIKKILRECGTASLGKSNPGRVQLERGQGC